MSAKTTKGGQGSVLASATGTWSGSVLPVTGDTITVARGDILHWDSGLSSSGAGISLGSNASGVGIGVMINGASSISYGTLIVDSGCTLHLCGYDKTTNAMMQVNQYGVFNPLAGSTVLGDAASDMQSCIVNNGQIVANGTSGSHITISIPAANIPNWATQVTNEAHSSLAAAGRPFVRQPSCLRRIWFNKGY